MVTYRKTSQDLGALRSFHVHCEGLGDIEDDTGRDKVQVMSLVPRDRSISSFSFFPVDSQTWSQTARSDSIRIPVSSKLALNQIETNSPQVLLPLTGQELQWLQGQETSFLTAASLGASSCADLTSHGLTIAGPTKTPGGRKPTKTSVG